MLRIRVFFCKNGFFSREYLVLVIFRCTAFILETYGCCWILLLLFLKSSCSHFWDRIVVLLGVLHPLVILLKTLFHDVHDKILILIMWYFAGQQGILCIELDMISIIWLDPLSWLFWSCLAYTSVVFQWIWLYLVSIILLMVKWGQMVMWTIVTLLFWAITNCMMTDGSQTFEICTSLQSYLQYLLCAWWMPSILLGNIQQIWFFWCIWRIHLCLDKSFIAIAADPMSEQNVRHLCKCQKYVMYMYVCCELV